MENLNNEIWISVRNYDGLYLISNTGRIKSLITNKILKQHKTINGYFFVNLYKNKCGKSKFIHHMVAESFLSHTVNGYTNVIDHIDNNKENNNANNLQIISNRQNSIKNKSPKSGYSCIYKNNKKWLVRVRQNGIKISLGTFENISDAVNCRDNFINKEIKEKIKEYKDKTKTII